MTFLLPHPDPRRRLLLAQDLRELGCREIATSAAAAARLRERRPTATELTDFLTDRNPFVRSGAAWWLRHLSDLPCETVHTLRAAIFDPNAHVVQAAVGTAGMLRLAAARDDVRSCLEDSHPGVVHAAIFALGRIGPAEEGRHLLRFLPGPPHLELAAVAALTQLRYAPAVTALLARLEACRNTVRHSRSQFELPRRYLAALVALQARQAIPLLIRLALEEVGLRNMAVQALIQLRAEEAAPALLPLLVRLQDSAHEEKLCTSLLFLMTAVDYRFAAPQVRSFLGHRLAGVRCAALKAVARWHDTAAAATVRDMARHDASAFVRPVAVDSLVTLIDRDALPDLLALADDANALVRAAVASALARLIDLPAARTALALLTADAAAPVSRAAQEALHGNPVAQDNGTAEQEQTLLPADLREQAAAARAFLRRWQAEMGERSPAEVQMALATLLRALAA